MQLKRADRAGKAVDDLVQRRAPWQGDASRSSPRQGPPDGTGAQDVPGQRSRLHGFLAATQAVAGDLALPALLRCIVEAARELVGARYGALGVVGPDGQLSEFVTVGLGPAAADRIGRAPEGAGILGLLISDPRPLRVTGLGAHPAAVGLPAGHPPVHSFLGVPVRVRDQVFGNLYLTEKLPDDPADGRTGGFTEEDEELLVSLAAWAGVAIENARLHEAARQRQQWLQAAQDIVAELLAEDGDALPLIASRARRTASADLAAVLVPAADDPQSLLVAAADGAGAEALVGTRVPRRSLAGRALAEQTGLLLADVQEHVASTRAVPDGAGVPLGPAVLVRVPGADRTEPGVLALTREQGSPPFDADDRDMITGFAGHAGLALQRTQAQRDRQGLLLGQDRDRIAGHLHDEVIQQLFATGLSLAGLAGRTKEPAVAAQLTRVVDDLDTTIRTIRQTIFQLQRRGGSTGLAERALAVVEEATAELRVHPAVRLEGPLDAVASAALDEHVPAVLRAALADAARHAPGGRADVVLRCTDGRFELVVAHDGDAPLDDDGVLADVVLRAQQLGGTCSRTASPERAGTTLLWSVPLP